MIVTFAAQIRGHRRMRRLVGGYRQSPGTTSRRPNFGCATQHNIAAVVANPEDFETPRTATPADAMRRYQVFVDYRKPKNTATRTSELGDADGFRRCQAIEFVS